MDPVKPNSSEYPGRKWTSEEIKIILDIILQENAAQEEPLKQIFNNILKERIGQTTKWDLIKRKVANLTSNFKKTESLAAKTVQGHEFCAAERQSWKAYYENGPRCSFVPDKPIRTHRALSNPMTDQVLTMQQEDLEISYLAHSAVLNTHIDGSGINPQLPSTSCHSCLSKPMDIPKKHQTIGERLKKFKKSSGYCLATLQAKLTERSKRKFEWERIEQEKKMEMSEKQLILAEEWTKAEIELKRKELELREKKIDQDEKLRILDMAKEERLRKYELELKYKSQL